MPNANLPIARPGAEDLVRPSPKQGLVLSDQPDGVVLWEKVDFLSLAQQFHHSQIALLDEHRRQNRWMRWWILLGILMILCTVCGGAVVLYSYTFSTRELEKNMNKELLASRDELSQKLYQHLNVQDQRYQNELEKLTAREKDGYRSLSELMMMWQDRQQALQKSYEEKFLALEKEKTELQQTIARLMAAALQNDLALTKAHSESDSLRKQMSALEQKLTAAEQQVKLWKQRAMEKLSSEELETLRKDLKDDK